MLVGSRLQGGVPDGRDVDGDVVGDVAHRPAHAPFQVPQRSHRNANGQPLQEGFYIFNVVRILYFKFTDRSVSSVSLSLCESKRGFER